MKITINKYTTAKGLTRWRARWYGKYNANGTRKRYSESFKLKKDAEEFVKTMGRKFDQGLSPDPSNETLKDYCKWAAFDRQQLCCIRKQLTDCAITLDLKDY
jgi:hypothetical protein